MQFKYEGKDNIGNIRNGLVVAEDQPRAESLLAENGIVILSLELVEENFFQKLWPFGKGVPVKELVLFSRQLATLAGAQVPLLQALRILSAQVGNGNLKKIIAELVTGIESGDSFSLSLSRHPEVFSNVYINVVHSGEISGSLEKSLLYLADQLEKDYDLNTKVRSALTYPAFIVIALVLVGSFMFIFILPKLTEILTSQGGDLPFVTVLLIKFTNFFHGFWWVLLLIVIGIYMAARYMLKTAGGRYFWDRMKLNIPIIGKIFQKIYLARFSRNLSTLIASGIPIIKSLETVAQLVNNVIYRDIIMEAASRLSTGRTISEVFANYPEMPVMVTQMIQVGEQSATLNTILAKLATYYEKEVDAQISGLATLIEPLIIMVLGVAVGILVAGILLPIYNLANTVS